MSDSLRPYPVFLRLDGRPVLVVGGGVVAASKLRGLLACGAVITVVAPRISPAIRAAAVRAVVRPFRAADLDDAWFVVAAATPDVNRRVARLAERRRIFVNAVDDPAAATAYLGGTVRRGGVTVAVSTGGEAPALAGLVREGLDAMLPADVAGWMAVARRARRAWRARGVPMPERRPLLLQAINRVYQRRRSAGEER